MLIVWVGGVIALLDNIAIDQVYRNTVEGIVTNVYSSYVNNEKLYTVTVLYFRKQKKKYGSK